MLQFLREAIRDFRTTGAVLPSSPVLARVMTRSLAAAPSPRRILEVGPGTGPFTREILRHLRDGDLYDIVEINPAFCEQLERTMLAPYRARGAGACIALHRSPIEDANVTGDYDFVVCGLPFNNFPPSLVRSIFRRIFALMRTGGELAYFEYAGVRAMKTPIVGSEGRRRIRGHRIINRRHARDHAMTRELVIGNVPPAFAVRLVKSEPKRTPHAGGRSSARGPSSAQATLR
jgi:phosphatidylethanolamine/phosphatidyl-N-methylethanolamine N-methyltransferase